MSVNPIQLSNSIMKQRGEYLSEKIQLEMPPLLGLGNDYSFIETIYDTVWNKEKPPAPHLKVSIVIPVYNRKEILAKTLAGIVHQTYPLELIEIIIADDGSKDNPEELIPQFEEFFPIKHVFQDDDGYRLSAVRNLGIAAAQHEHIIILDCDMLPVPTLVESYMKWLHISSKVIIIGYRKFVCSDGLSAKQLIHDISPALELPNVNSENVVITTGTGPTVDWREQIYTETNMLKDDFNAFRGYCGGNVAFPKKLIDEIGGFDEDFNHWGGEDTEFGFRAEKQGYWFIPEKGALALHQEPPGGENETDREEGRAITHGILVDKCPKRYRKYIQNKTYEIPKVSVFMPAYNCQDFIKEAILSVINQSYADFELIITDDGGTDATAEIILKFTELDSRIKFYPKENGGIGSACNYLLERAKGEYALQLDGDDVISPDTIEKMVQVLDQNEIGFVYGDAYLVNSDLEFTQRSYSWSIFDRQKMIDGGMHVHPPRMFRMRDFNRTQKYNEVLENAVDYDFFLKLSEVSDGYHYQRGFYLYRRHGKNTSDVHTGIQTKNSHLAIKNSLVRLGIDSMVIMKPDETNPRRIHIVVNEKMGNPLQMNEYFRRFEIPTRLLDSLPEFTVHSLFTSITDSSLNKNNRVTKTSNLRRRLRIGPFSDPEELIRARETINENRSWNMHYQSISTRLDSDLILVTGHFSNESSAQNASTFLRNLGLATEIIANGLEHPFAYPSNDTLVDLEKIVTLSKKSPFEKFEEEISKSTNNANEDYNPSKRWHFDSGRLWLNYKGLEIWFEMPKDWSFEETHADLFKVAEFVLLSPYEPTILENWKPSRGPGFRPGLAFSAGVDSTAAMCLMPDRTLLFYHERSGIDSIMNHENANRFINHLIEEEGRPVIRVKSNHEISRTIDGKSPGFTTDYACAVHVILLADHFGLDSMATGMPLENSYLFHGQKYRDFKETYFWKKHSKLFESIGLPIYQPVMGCSELVSRNIVDAFGYGGFAQSCLRAQAGTSCGRCWKCFRKNTLIGKPFTMSNEISTFLAKVPLKMAASTIYSIQNLNKKGLADEILLEHEHIRDLIKLDVSFLEGYYPPATELIPEKYKQVTEKLLSKYILEMKNIELFESFDV